MSKQLERILDLLLAENTEQAEKLLHEYVVSKARQEYEKVLEEEIDQSGDFEDDILDDDEEIDAEEFGEADESEDDFDMGDDDMDMDVSGEADVDMDDDMGSDMDMDMDVDDEADVDMGTEDDLEDKVDDLEAELEDLRLEFERLMGGDETDDTGMDFGDDDFGGDDEMNMDLGDEEDDNELMDDVEYDLDEAEEIDEEDEELEEATNFSKTASEQPMKGGNLKGSEADNTKSPYTQAPKPASVGKSGAPVRSKDGSEGKQDHGSKPSNDSTHHNINVPHKGAPKAKDGKSNVDGSNKTSPLTKVKKPS